MNFSGKLTHWYSDNKRSMPWRETRNPYHIWLSEVILQQTQISQGLPFYNAFIENFPTVFDLAKANEEHVLKLWQGLGYYSRARNLHHTAKLVADQLNGKFPDTYDELIKLKGVGDYTASAISSICFDEPNAVVDGNVYRLLSRYFGIETPINSSQGIKEFKALAQSLLPEDNIGEHNQAIMEFGSRQCKPSSPNCMECAFQTSCVALQKNKVNSLPVKTNKLKIRKRFFNFLVVISKDHRTILQQRKDKGIWQNLYQFPLIETNRKLSIKTFSSNVEVQSVLGNESFQFNLYNEKEIIHKLSHQHLLTRFWIINVDQLPEPGMPISEIRKLPVPILIAKFIEGFNF